MTEKERVTVDFDAECYYLDGDYWESWDNYGEEMANTINKLLNEQDTKIKQLESRNKRQYELLNKYDDLIFARDWKTLEKIVEEVEKQEELLQKEFRCDVE